MEYSAPREVPEHSFGAIDSQLLSQAPQVTDNRDSSLVIHFVSDLLEVRRLSRDATDRQPADDRIRSLAFPYGSAYRLTGLELAVSLVGLAFALFQMSERKSACPHVV